MAEEAGKMLEMMTMPEVSKRYSEICKMQPAQLVKRLEIEGVSVLGEMPELRGRLLRLEVRRIHPEISIPWYLEDEVIIMKETSDSSKIGAEARWQLREASMKTEIANQLYESSDDSQPKLDANLTKTVKNEQQTFVDLKNENYRDTNNNKDDESVYYVSEPAAMKTVLTFAYNALKLALYVWFLDYFIFYNKGFPIYIVIYWIIMTLYSLNKDEHRICVYIQNHPYQHRTKLLLYSLSRIVTVTVSFTCINFYIWFDNIMFALFIIFNFLTELCILIREINVYERNKYAPNYFLYSQRKMKCG